MPNRVWPTPRHYGTNRMKASDLIEDALNGRTPTVYDQIDKDTRVINPAGDLSRPREAAATEGEIQRVGMEGRRPRAAPGPAL